MNKTEFDNLITELDFKFLGRITAHDGRPNFQFELAPNDNLLGWVYIWVERSPDGQYEVRYVGHTKKTVPARSKNHVGGFRGGSVTGSRHATKLTAAIANGSRFEVFERRPQTVNRFGIEVSGCTVEEEALIQKLCPTWNYF